MTAEQKHVQELYEKALYHFQRAEWDRALAAANTLREHGYTSPELQELVDDAQLKAKLEGFPVTLRRPPRLRRAQLPRRLRLAGALLLLLLVAAGSYLWLAPQPREALIAIMPPSTTTPPPATSTRAVPTATAVPPTNVAPTPSQEQPEGNTAAPAQPGTLQILPAPGQAQTARLPRNIELIVDASGSMLAPVAGAPKIELARQALQTVIATLPEDLRLALRTYGTQRSGDCGDLSLLKPLGPYSSEELLAGLVDIQPAAGSMTPLAASLEAVDTDLQDAQGSSAVILVSDGVETCDRDPVAVVERLQVRRPNLRIHVIGFDIGGAQAGERLRAIANAGAGSYFDALDAEQLTAALQEAIRLSYQVVDGQGRVAGSGFVGGATQSLAPGRYHVQLAADQPIETEITISSGRQLILLLRRDGPQLQLVETRRSSGDRR